MRRTTGTGICALCHEEDSSNTRRQTGSSDSINLLPSKWGVEKRWPFPFPSPTYAIYRARLLPSSVMQLLKSNDNIGCGRSLFYRRGGTWPFLFFSSNFSSLVVDTIEYS